MESRFITRFRNLGEGKTEIVKIPLDPIYAEIDEVHERFIHKTFYELIAPFEDVTKLYKKRKS